MDRKPASFECPSGMDKDEYIRYQDDVLATLEDEKEKLEERASYGDDRDVKKLNIHQAEVAASNHQKRSHKTLMGSAAESTAVLVSGLAHSECSWIGCFLVFLTTVQATMRSVKKKFR